MNKAKWILTTLFMVCALAPIGICEAQLSVNEFDRELERFIRDTNQDVKELDREVKFILTKINNLELPRCVVSRWLRNYESSRSSTIQILRDRLDYQEDLVAKVNSRLGKLFNNQENLSGQISSFARKIAANEGGISRVEETIIPDIRSDLNQNRALISDNLALLLVVDAKYDAKYRDICSRMRATEQQLAQQSQQLKAHANQISNLHSERHQVLRPSYDSASSNYDSQVGEHNQAGAQSANPNYQPQRVRSQLTPGCVLYLVQANVEYQVPTRTFWSDGSYSDQTTIYRGNIYQSCSGQLVLLYR